jgi:cell division protein FtsL
MRWQRYIWAATIVAIWLVSLMIVDSAARHTRMGYQQQELRRELQKQEESNLRLQCEMSVLHDLEKAEEYAESHHMVTSDHDVIDTFTTEYSQ